MCRLVCPSMTRTRPRCLLATLTAGDRELLLRCGNIRLEHHGDNRPTRSRRKSIRLRPRIVKLILGTDVVVMSMSSGCLIHAIRRSCFLRFSRAFVASHSNPGGVGTLTAAEHSSRYCTAFPSGPQAGIRGRCQSCMSAYCHVVPANMIGLLEPSPIASRLDARHSLRTVTPVRSTKR
jgi:hypothetical protein